jgi:hypothetical protein
MAQRESSEPARRNGRLRIPLPFEEALKAATETKPPEKPERKPRSKKPAKG